MKHIMLEQNQTDARYRIEKEGICQTLKSRMGTGGGNVPILIQIYEKGDAMEETTTIVRRLTPTECERLQGFPDDWTLIGEKVGTKVCESEFGQYEEDIYEYVGEDGKKHKVTDSARYKALGNSIALPQWWWLVNRMKPYLEEGATMGSLFDGIGGFPLVWETCYGGKTARWASEIEPFPIAVTKQHFGDEESVLGDLYEDN